MKKIVKFAVLLCIITTAVASKAQTTIGITVVRDETSNTDKAYALQELIVQKKYGGVKGVLQPQLVDFVNATTYAITGKFQKSWVSLSLLKDAKKIGGIECENKWKTISEKMDEAFGNIGFKSASPKVKIDEGDDIKVYAKKMEDNLPYTITFAAPQGLKEESLGIGLKINFYKPKNIPVELKELHGKYVDANISDSQFFGYKDIPRELKEAVKPLASPITKMVILPVNYIKYGNILIDTKEYAMAQHCYLTALAGTQELIGSISDKAKLRAFSFQKLADMQMSISDKRVELQKIYNACAALNNAALGNRKIKMDDDNYVENVEIIKKLVAKAEENAKQAKAARFGAIMSAVNTGLSQTALSMNAGDMTQMNNSLQMSQLTLSRETEQLAANQKFKNEIKLAAADIKGSEFLVDAGNAANIASYLASETYYFLSQYPDVAKQVLEAYAQEKPHLKELVARYYNTGGSADKTATLSPIIGHISFIEAAARYYEAKGEAVAESVVKKF